MTMTTTTEDRKMIAARGHASYSVGDRVRVYAYGLHRVATVTAVRNGGRELVMSVPTEHGNQPTTGLASDVERA